MNEVEKKKLDWVVDKLKTKPSMVKVIKKIIHYQEIYLTDVEINFPEINEKITSDDFIDSWINNNQKIAEQIQKENAEQIKQRGKDYLHYLVKQHIINY
jgi:hypothetical protein